MYVLVMLSESFFFMSQVIPPLGRLDVDRLYSLLQHNF